MDMSIGAVIAVVVLLINILLASWITQVFEESEPGIYTLIAKSEKSCQQAKGWSTCLHLTINVVGTLLLGASNYCVQCSTSPTRSVVDAAHRKGSWLSIGVPSLSNLGSTGWKKVIVWPLLGASSVPLHLV